MRRAYAYTLAAVLGWAVGPAGSKALLASSRDGVHPHPLQVAFWAISAGWLLLLCLLAARGRLQRLGDFAPRGWVVLLAMGALGWAGYPVSLNFALAHLPLPQVVVINYLHPVFTVVLQGAFLGALLRPLSGWEHVSGQSRMPPVWRVASGLALCLAGVAVIAAKGRLGALSVLPSATGALAALAAALSWGIYSNLGRFAAVKAGREATGLADVQTFAAMTLGLGLMAAALVWSDMLAAPTSYVAQLHLGRTGSVDVGALAIVAAVGLCVYCVGFTSWLIALELGRSARGAHKIPPLTYLTPVLAVALGWLLLHEPFGHGFWEGAVLIGVGNALNVWRTERGSPCPQP